MRGNVLSAEMYSEIAFAQKHDGFDKLVDEEGHTATSQKYERFSHLLFKMHQLAGSGKYQVLMIVALTLCIAGASFLIGILGYVVPNPKASCQILSSEGLTFDSCSENEACKMIADGNTAKIYFEYETWTEKYQLYCERAYLRNWGQTLMIFLSAVVPMLLLYLADIMGRRISIFLNSFLLIGGVVSALFVDIFLLKCALLGVALSSVNIAGPYITFAACEYSCVTTRLSRILIVVGFTALPLGTFCLSLLASISMNATFLYWSTTIACIIGGILPILVFLESPVFYLKEGKIPEMVATVEKIRNINQVDPNPELLEWMKTSAEDWSSKHKNKHGPEPEGTYSQIFKNKQMLVNVISISMVATSFNILFFSIALNIDKLGSDSPSINGVVTNTVQVISTLLMMPIFEKIEKKKWHIWSQITILGLGGVLLVVDLTMKPESLATKYGKLFVGGVLFTAVMIALFPVLFTFAPELFTLEVRGTAMSIIVVVMNSLTTAAPWLADLGTSRGYNFLISCSFPLLLSLPLTFFVSKIHG